MNVAILNISIGKYSVFWQEFYQTFEKFFLPNSEKHYYVFTDSIDIEKNTNSSVSVIKQDNLGWPYNTLLRFQMFLKIKTELQKYDYIFFANGNAVLKQELNENFINYRKEIITIVHPGIYGTPKSKLPLERNTKSGAYVKYGEEGMYVQGAFIGGKAQSFLSMAEKLNCLILEDIRKGIIAIWHDESFLNKYIINRKDVQIMGRQYLYYEEYVFPWQPVIMLRNKRAYGDIRILRGQQGCRRKYIMNKLMMSMRNLKHTYLIKIGKEKMICNITLKGEYVDKDLT